MPKSRKYGRLLAEIPLQKEGETRDAALMRQDDEFKKYLFSTEVMRRKQASTCNLIKSRGLALYEEEGIRKDRLLSATWQADEKHFLLWLVLKDASGKELRNLRTAWEAGFYAAEAKAYLRLEKVGRKKVISDWNLTFERALAIWKKENPNISRRPKSTEVLAIINQKTVSEKQNRAGAARIKNLWNSWYKKSHGNDSRARPA